MDGNDYKMGWLIVAFDLPVVEPKQRKAATKFRDFLLDDGYQMIQYSVYARAMVTHARMETHLERIKKNVPSEGRVRVIFITQAQWERAYIIHGDPEHPEEPEAMPNQLHLW